MPYPCRNRGPREEAGAKSPDMRGAPLLLMVVAAGCADPNKGFRPPVTDAIKAEAAPSPPEGQSDLTRHQHSTGPMPRRALAASAPALLQRVVHVAL